MFKINLQQFAADFGGAIGGDGGSNAGSVPEPATPAAQPQTWGGVTPDVPNPLTALGAEPSATGLEGEPAPTPAQELLDFGGRKVPKVDPSLDGLHTDWTELNRSYTQQSQELQTYRSQMEQMNQMLQMYQQQFQQFQQAPQPQTQAEAQPQPEPFDKDQFFETWYENPEEAFSKLSSSLQSQFEQKLSAIEQRFSQYVEPMVKEREYTTQLQQLAGKYQDFGQYTDNMSALESQQPGLADKIGLENLYLMAKGTAVQAAPTPDQLLQDPNFRSKILSDQAIQQEFLRSYMANKQQTNQQTPNVMGNGVGGQAPTMPQSTPKTLGEASKMFRQFLGQ